jgi:hypothetical protein
LEKNQDEIKCDWLSLNPNPSAIPLLKKNQDKIYWDFLSENPSIFEINYDVLKEKCNLYKEELMQITMHPSRIQKYLDMGFSIEELDDII